MNENKKTSLRQTNMFAGGMAYDYDLIGMKVMVSLIDKLQDSINESINHRKQIENKIYTLNLFKNNDSKIRVDINYSDLGVSTGQYGAVKIVLQKLATLPINIITKDPLTNQEVIKISGFLRAYIPTKSHSKQFYIEMDRDIAEEFVNCRLGYSKFIKETALVLNKKYAVRLYFYLNSWKDKGKVTILYKNLRRILGVTKSVNLKKDIYVRFNDFNKRVLEDSKVCLDELSDLTFDYKLNYEDENFKKADDPNSITFFIKDKNSINKLSQDTDKGVKNSVLNILNNHLTGLSEEIKEDIIRNVTKDNFQEVVGKISNVADRSKKGGIYNLDDYVSKVFEID